jgi:hypothetical protein
MKKYIFILLFTSTGCSTLIPYTDRIRIDLEDAGIPVENTQFYITQNITIQKEDNQTTIKAKNGIIERKKENVKDIIKFGIPNTQTKAIGKFKNNNLYIYFEPDNEIKTERGKSSYQIYSQNNQIMYAGSIYRITNGNGAIIKIKKTDYTKYKKNIRTVKGMKVN